MSDRPNVTVQDLLDRGYRPFVDGMRNGQFIEGNWQLRVEDEVGTRYFVTVTGYRFPEQPVRFAANVQLHERERFTGPTFNVERSFVSDLDETEAFFGRMWDAMGLDYYERHTEYEGVPRSELPGVAASANPETPGPSGQGDALLDPA